MSRRPPVRRTRKSPKRVSTPTKPGEPQPLALTIAAAAGVGFCGAVGQWLLGGWWWLAVFAAVVVGAGGLWLTQWAVSANWDRVHVRRLRYGLPQLDGLHHEDFEFAVRDLMRRDGCADAVQVGGAGDNGADVTATDPLGRRWVIQCKHRQDGASGTPVGTPDLHVLNGTGRQLHGGDVVVLVTNGRFTAGCAPLAKSQKLHLVDRGTLGEWAGGSHPLWELLQRLPPSGRRAALSP
ncbi:restriction endonuclease [Streptomyces sp. NBC_00140]|uniref:restriction endonuclease n=1 Tax=Streptomyces sp. NBC_00140 TaxID=2975664 RepID=UPI002256017F|nr:restriction endonuclease [Streptomyces sp. NBC_00140]MCX5334332.1 restriction endonuclease [Streptomyces sp. NBC_00140]